MSINYTDTNTFIFTLARMNPPTPGHLYVIRRLIQEAINKNIQNVYVILSKTNDNNENPIPCPEKINVLGDIDDVSKTMINSEKNRMMKDTDNPEMKSKIEQVKVHTICVPERKGATPFTPLYDILGANRNIPDINLFLIIGDDRKNMLDSITDFFFKKWNNVKSVDGIILPREEMSQYKELSKDPAMLDKLNISELPINAMSASFVRNIVKNNRRDKFFELYSPFLDESKIPGLYEAILEGIHSLPPNKKQDGPTPELKYRYPMIKNISITEMPNDLSESPVPFKKTRTNNRINYGGKKTQKRNKRNKRNKKNKSYKKNKKNKKNKQSYTNKANKIT
jgi:nicotinic acid mononucleotide adenylyltransferase